MTGRQSHFDPGGSDFLDTVGLIIDRHRQNATEADVRAAVGNFLVFTGIATEEDLHREQDWIDLQSTNLIIETKRRIGTRPGFTPDPANVEQLDGYMRNSIAAGKPRRLGILTDGRYWLLRVHGRPEIVTHPPYGFELKGVDGGVLLFEWLRDELGLLEAPMLTPSEEEVRDRLGGGPYFERDMAALERLYELHKDDPSIRVKRDLWRDLLATALGEVVEKEADLDQLFLRHTYLSAVVGLAVQSAFGIDIRTNSAPNPERLLGGHIFVADTGVRGVVESDFFIWPAEVEQGVDWVSDLATGVACFDWTYADYDFVRVLYQSVMPSEDRRRLGEYYTPDWLAEAIVKRVVPEPLHKRVLDPACGSGTFLRAAIRQYITAAQKQGWQAERILDGLMQSVIGVDVHPVSVHLARATWVLAAREIIIGADAQEGKITVPVYLGDSLQLRTDNGNLLGEKQVTISVPSQTGGKHRRLNFPRSLVDQGDRFDGTMLRIAENIATGGIGTVALDDAEIPPGVDRDILEETVKEMEELHQEGRNHIWAYYTRNLVRPVWLSTEEGKVDVIVGNPPWITYSRTRADLRDTLEGQSKDLYKIWQGGRFAPHQDIAGLFYTRCVDLYLKQGGRIGMVLPHSALQAGQYAKWRKGEWSVVEVDMNHYTSWDLEKITPNTFFPVPACVIFAIKADRSHRASPLKTQAQLWIGPQGGPFQYKTTDLQDSSRAFESPYGARAFQGATFVPRALLFVEVSEAPAALVSGICSIQPRRSAQEKDPWKNLSTSSLYPLSGSIEKKHIYSVHTGETIAPFLLLSPRQVALPMQDRWAGIDYSDVISNIGGVNSRNLGTRMRARWEAMCDLWDNNKGANNKLSLLERIDYMKQLSNQMEKSNTRLVYTTSGIPTATVLTDPDMLVDSTLYWIICNTIDEAHYLAAIINSNTLLSRADLLMPKGAYGSRHLHKHLWRLSIPEYDRDNSLHIELASLGRKLHSQAQNRWKEEEAERTAEGKTVSVTVARRVLREWLTTNPRAQRIEDIVKQLVPRR